MTLIGFAWIMIPILLFPGIPQQIVVHPPNARLVKENQRGMDWLIPPLLL